MGKTFIGGFIIFWIFGILIGILLSIIFNFQPTTANTDYTLPLNISCPLPVCPQPILNCTCAQCYYSPKIYNNQITEIAENLREERAYEIHVWDCSDMSDELAKRLRNAGYKKCYMQCGIYDNKTEHCWVNCNNIIIESTKGRIIEGGEYELYK